MVMFFSEHFNDFSFMLMHEYEAEIETIQPMPAHIQCVVTGQRYTAGLYQPKHYAKHDSGHLKQQVLTFAWCG